MEGGLAPLFLRPSCWEHGTLSLMPRPPSPQHGTASMALRGGRALERRLRAWHSALRAAGGLEAEGSEFPSPLAAWH